MNLRRRDALQRGILHALPLSIAIWAGLAAVSYAAARVVLAILNP
jgi:hypothetical protein